MTQSDDGTYRDLEGNIVDLTHCTVVAQSEPITDNCTPASAPVTLNSTNSTLPSSGNSLADIVPRHHSGERQLVEKGVAHADFFEDHLIYEIGDMGKAMLSIQCSTALEMITTFLYF